MTLVTEKETFIMTTSATDLRRNELLGLACCYFVRARKSEAGGQAASYRRLENASLFCGEFQLRKNGE